MLHTYISNLCIYTPAIKGYMKVAEKIKKARKRKKLSQGELSKIIGITAAHVSRLETARYQPSIEVFKKISDALEVSADYLLSDSDEDPKEVRIENEALAERIRLLNTLDGKDREVILYMIDSILTKKKMLSLLQGNEELITD